MKKQLTCYLAGPWLRKGEAKAGREVLQQSGISVTSRWIDLPDDTDQEDPVYMTTQAQYDLEDVLKADCVIVLNLQTSEGKAVEQGLAIALKKPLIIVGKPRLNIFQWLPQVVLVDTLDEAIAVAKESMKYA